MRQYNLNCNICDLTFKSRPEYMKHRKLCHVDILPECKNNMEGVCQYGDKSVGLNTALKNMIQRNKIKVKK